MSPKQAVLSREAKKVNGDFDVVETDVTNTYTSPQIGDEIDIESPHKQWLYEEHDYVLPSTREERQRTDMNSRVPRATLALTKNCFRM